MLAQLRDRRILEGEGRDELKPERPFDLPAKLDGHDRIHALPEEAKLGIE